MAAEFELGDAGFGLPDQIDSLEPYGERQFGSMHECAGGESSLMAAGSSLILVENAAVDQAILLAAVEAVELRQGEAFLELDRAAGYCLTGIHVPLHSSVSLGAVRAG